MFAEIRRELYSSFWLLALRRISAVSAVVLGLGLFQNSPATGQSDSETSISGEPEEVNAEDDSGKFREFTDTKGRSVEARLLSVMNGEARIELRKSRQVLSWPIANFSEADIVYMKRWADENVSYRFVVRHRVVPNAPRNPVGGENRQLGFSTRAANSSLSLGSNSDFLGDDNDSEVQYLTLSIVNGSSAQLDDVEVKVWVVLNNRETHKDRKDTEHFVSLGAKKAFSKVEQTETLNLAGGFPVKKIRKKVMEYTTFKSPGAAGFGNTTTTKKLKSVGTIRESLAGVLVQIYHEGKLVDEYSDYDSDLKESGFNPVR